MDKKIFDLKNNHKYKEARRLLNKIDKLTTQNKRDLAECYYKDFEIHKERSYEKAIEILNSIVLSEDNNPSETLCLLGAVYKRKWEYERKLEFLYLSIEKYITSYTKYNTNDMYYGAINASFLYDVLANVFKKNDSTYSKELVKKAEDIRIEIIDTYEKQEEKDIWLLHTLSQAYLGINDIEKCKEKLNEANKEANDRENYTSFKQLTLLAKLKGIKNCDFLSSLVNSEDINFDKKGLALSGGGFRASFFHLGTLAKLAECNILKDIEVISTVSGGSIVGVLYYLKLQKLLEEKLDKDIEKEDYIELVEDLIDEFYEVVQSDIRNSVITEKFVSNTLLKVMNPLSSYSRTNKLGELYQRRFYNKYQKYMKDLIITPKDSKNEKVKFRPRFDNWKRINKVPLLVINATNLNSGHTWQFQATKMGEPEYMTDLEIDKNNRFDWVRYDSKGLSKKFKNYPIGQAVACSSAVPMLFTPIVLKDLYEGYKLSISDGGVYDNQGFSGLLSEECDYIICSDASGQMDNQKTSTTTLLGMNKRTIDIQMDRNRELIFEDLNNRKEKGILKGFLFTHLKEGLESNEIKQEDTIQKFEENGNKEFQGLISKIRTDLDVFSKTEAYSLMYNGYELFEDKIKKESIEESKIEKWIFLSVEENIENKSNKLMDELKLSKHQFTRRFRKWLKG